MRETVEAVYGVAGGAALPVALFRAMHGDQWVRVWGDLPFTSTMPNREGGPFRVAAGKRATARGRPFTRARLVFFDVPRRLVSIER